MLGMHCPFCQSEMKSIDSGSPPPRLTVVWVCRQCSNEVRVAGERLAGSEQEWQTTMQLIFVSYNDRKYCLMWDYGNNIFRVLDVAAYAGSGYIMQTDEMPVGVTPDNVLDKLKIYLTYL